MCEITEFPRENETANSKLVRIMLNLEMTLHSALECQSSECRLPNIITASIQELLGLIDGLKKGINVDEELSND